MPKPEKARVRRPRPAKAPDTTSFPQEVWRSFAERFGWSERDGEVAQLLYDGVELKLIAGQLQITVNTVLSHVKQLYEKTGVHGRSRWSRRLFGLYLDMLQGDKQPYPPPITEQLILTRTGDGIPFFLFVESPALANHGRFATAHPQPRMATPATRRRDRQSNHFGETTMFGAWVMRGIGALLLFASALKIYGLGYEPVGSAGIFSSPEMQVMLVECEVVMGFWLLSGKGPVGSWLVALVTFGCFAGINAYQGWLGRASCGCFGPLVKINPWIVFGLDIVILAALTASRPDFSGLRGNPRVVIQRAMFQITGGCIGVSLVLGALIGMAKIGFGSTEAALAYVRGERISFQPRLLDIGQGDPGEFREATVELRNWTDRPIRLVGGTSDCSCVITEDLPLTIPAGERRPITVKMIMPAGHGIFNRKAVLLTDDGDSWRLWLRITGIVSKSQQERNTPESE